MNQRTPFSWLINHLTYLQTFIFICILFFLSLIPIAYFWNSTHLERIQLIDNQLEELKEEKALQVLFKEIQEHRALTQRLVLAGTKELQLEMEELDNQIQTSITSFMELYKSKTRINTLEPTIWQKMNHANLQSRWETMLQKIPKLSHQEVVPLNTSIIHDLLIQFSYLSDKVGISYFKEIDNYSLIDAIFLRLPSIQEYVAQLILICDKSILTEGKNFPKARMTDIINFIEADLAYLNFGNQIDLENPEDRQQVYLKSLQNYVDSLETLLKIVKIHFIAVDAPNITLAEFHPFGNAALKNGFTLWDEGFVNLTYIFQVEREHIIYQLWFVLIITVLLTGFAFLLGLVLTLSGTQRLSQLTDATVRFSNGDLSIRVPDNNRDEIGRQAQAFNQMAQKLEEIISHLYELLDATTTLAEGNLTARIQIRDNDSEFDQVAQSFNKMAETFENIIGRLQQIGTMLTTSASEIATASKEQETVIIEQEATTREIAVAANEISSTAKEFAASMNEMSGMAEKTSDLALTGKGSLNNMETIMSQMVDASTNIASKLAVLNEKAGNITGVITTITKVADQTNLLSLNASIEAEKAGEYGRSFAVIAREIRRLADQTAIATLDIEKIVNEIMGAVSTSVMGVDDFTQEIRKGVEQVRIVSGQLAKIIEKVQVFTARFELLNQGMQAQSTGAEQINEAISQLSQTAQQTTMAIHQFHKTIQELNKAASELRILTPFISSDLTEETAPKEGRQERPGEKQPHPELIPPESDKKFKRTLSNLNQATSELKKLNQQMLPPPERKKPEV